MSKNREEDLAREVVQCLMPMYSDIEFGLIRRQTLWKQQSFVYASSKNNREKNIDLNVLLTNKERACVLVHNKSSKAKSFFPVASEIAFGKLTRIFDTNSIWNKEKCIVFSKYKYVIFMDPPDDDEFQELEIAMGPHFGLIRDNTQFIINNTTN